MGASYNTLLLLHQFLSPILTSCTQDEYKIEWKSERVVCWNAAEMLEEGLLNPVTGFLLHLSHFVARKMHTPTLSTHTLPNS